MQQEKVSVVLIPGFMLDESLWDDVVAALPSTWHIVRASLTQGNNIAEIAQYIAQQVPVNFILIGLQHFKKFINIHIICVHCEIQHISQYSLG